MKRAGSLVPFVMLFGCGEQRFDHLDYAPGCDYDCPISDGFEPNRISLSVGSVQAARITAIDTGGNQMVCDIGLVPEDRSLMSFERSSTGATVVIGLTPGSTRVGVSCDGDIVGHVEGAVVDASSP